MSRPAEDRWEAAPDALGHRVSRGVVLSAAAGDFALVLHPAEVVWPLFSTPCSLDDVVGALRAEGATEPDARQYASSLIDDLRNRRLLRDVPAGS